MSAASTFSPDSTLAGPVVQVLRGCIDESLKGPRQLEKGEPLYYTKNRVTGKAMFMEKPTTSEPDNPVRYVILAEAVVVHKSDFEISVPVVVSGAAQVTIESGRNTTYLAGHRFVMTTAAMKEPFQLGRLTHEEFISSQAGIYDVFVETF